VLRTPSREVGVTVASWLGNRARRAWFDPSESGPVAARAFHRVLAIVFLMAWLSLAVQVDVLIGSHGLLPIRDQLPILAERHTPFFEFPTLWRYFPSDAAMHLGLTVGIVASLGGLAGLAPRVCIALNTALYLSFAVACRTFMRFQWDSMLVEAGALAVFLPRERRAPWIHLLFRVLLFKLYFESGWAKWNSATHDWRNGSAMSLYYETAPLPTWLAWYAHHLPAWWHRLESWSTLILELVVPFLVFGPRRARLVAAFAFAAFQLGDLATANYGFFCYLSLALEFFLFSDRDLRRTWLRILRCAPARVRRWRAPAILRTPRLRRPSLAMRRVRVAIAVSYSAFYLLASTYEAFVSFARTEEWQLRLDKFDPVDRRVREFRLANVYHLFGSITEARIEPEIQIATGDEWQTYDLHYKPGDPGRAPPFVAPHQPRVDFQLWFYGVSLLAPPDVDESAMVRTYALRRIPIYVVNLLKRVCHEPSTVQSLFREQLPTNAAAVRLAFWDYRFTDARERARGLGWWRRRFLANTPTIPCAALR
jgi:uncharacterized membrane protein YphA (DoxX/SURF4 family)